ncbi:hypothetical protein [Bosea rubneri]|uniref:Uncharacterized protein n=1 Tax=Bosea rubneri TaxID=3075434 RepID=A0ABU3SGP7_9HYPH|nr:hypothetical protein [Bosea sp. ZW T0_25]MDU0343952.1 hypothetical protein [Bosea sp. ZW T0_25]
MTDRTTKTEVIFRHPFRLSALSNPQPPGTYRVVTDEEEILGLSFQAFRRAATMLEIPAIELSRGSSQIFLVDPVELEAALEKDKLAYSRLNTRKNSCAISAESRGEAPS